MAQLVNPQHITEIDIITVNDQKLDCNSLERFQNTASFLFV